MSASRNKSKSSSSGLRFLWIPGRKKHNHKGHYSYTTKQIDYYSGKQKNTEPWSLGGSKGQEKLIDSEIPGSTEGPSGVLDTLPACAIAAGASNTAMKHDETNRFAILEEKNEKETSNDSDLLKSNESIADDKTDRVDTLQMSEKKESNHMKSKDRINSIESLHDKKLKNSNFDITDSSLYLSKYDNGKKKKGKNKHQRHDDTEEDPDSKTVKCLYYTLMCCECTIS